MQNNVIINFWGGPGSGKTFLAQKLTVWLKENLNVPVGLVTEFATDQILANNLNVFDYQYYVTANQMYMQECAENVYQHIVTDSPVLYGMIYHNWEDKNTDMLFEYFKSKVKNKNNVNIFIERNDQYYVTNGRIHTLKESKDIDRKILNFLPLVDYSYITIKNDKEGFDTITKIF